MRFKNLVLFPAATTLAFSMVSTVKAEDITTSKLGSLNQIFVDVVGNYDRQDGLYKVTLPGQNTNGEDLICIIIKDTTVVYNLQMTPQTLSQGTSLDCNWAPHLRQP